MEWPVGAGCVQQSKTGHLNILLTREIGTLQLEKISAIENRGQLIPFLTVCETYDCAPKRVSAGSADVENLARS